LGFTLHFKCNACWGGHSGPGKALRRRRRMRSLKRTDKTATVNQHPPAHHEGWMVSGEEAVFCWVPDLWVTMVVSG